MMRLFFSFFFFFFFFFFMAVHKTSDNRITFGTVFLIKLSTENGRNLILGYKM